MLRIRLLVTALVAAAGLAGAAHATTRTTAPAATLTKGVVLVTTNLAYENASAAGTGIVLTKDGEIMTNNHVIRGATTINVIVPATKKTYSASVVGYDPTDDIALIKVDGTATFTTATRGDSSKLKIGQPTRAVGNANGGGKLVITTGKVTALRQSIVVNDDQGGTARLSGLIQTSAKLVPGDSGGPLLDANGRVIGVDAAGSSNYQMQVSDGYAIPINKAYSLVKLMETGQASTLVHIGQTAFLGMTVDEVTGGIVVEQIIPGGASEAAGLVPGDVMTSIDGQPLTTLDDLRAALFLHHPGDTVALGVIDALGNATTVTLAPGDGPPQ